MEIDIRQELSAFGAGEHEIKLLNSDRPDLVDYLDLLAIRRKAESQVRSNLTCPDAVVEYDGRPALYAIDVSRISDVGSRRQDVLLQLNRTIACRGDSAPIAIVEPGQIVLYGREDISSLADPIHMSRSDARAPMLIRDLVMGSGVGGQSMFSQRADHGGDNAAIYDLLLRLLNQVTDELLDAAPLNKRYDEVLSLIGRALFTRFLIDRDIINKRTFPEMYAQGGDPTDCFQSWKAAALTNRWLQENFTGELLPLPHKNIEQYFRGLSTASNDIFRSLSKILHRSDWRGQLHLDWGFVDFAHVPIGLLSQVYERYAHKWFGSHAEGESVHYTPHHIANYVVRQVFEGITTVPKHAARICDPAAGAGIFLVLSLRRLISERWKATGVRPDKRAIREVLYRQIRGFDINEHALKLAALGLYLTCLELDPNPFPPKALGFKELRGLCLFPTRLTKEEFPAYPILGSLGPAIGEEHNHCYDAVIGNPPWTSWEGPAGRELNKYVENMIREIARKRSTDGKLLDIANSYRNPDLVPDLPFVWRAMEWAKRDGVIGLVLGARLLFKSTANGAQAREALFRALRVTGVVNGAGLESVEVWPGINQPFCIVFAKNRVPEDGEAFFYLSPERDAALNSRAIIRVDYQSAQPVDPQSFSASPFLLKTLFVGTALDAELMSRLIGLLDPGEKDEPRAIRFKEYWTEARNLYANQGYQVANRDNDAREILALNGAKLTTLEKVGYLIDANGLPKFDEDRLHRPRRPEIYRPPLVILKQAPGDGDSQIRARMVLGKRAIVYNESFYGCSAPDTPFGRELVSYLFLLVNSDLFAYYTLMTSSKFGIERRVLHVQDLKRFPIVRYESLSSELRARCKALAQVFARGESTLARVNDLVCRIYSLDYADRRVIRDTLDVRMPFKDSRDLADRRPTEKEMERFISYLQERLQPFFSLTNENITVERLSTTSEAWGFFRIDSDARGARKKSDVSISILSEELADKTGASRIIVPQGPHSLVIGLCAKYRYWTITRARQCAIDVLRDFASSFPGLSRD